ncbi:MAG TPA: asparagine synthase-related protein, partial [Solirubrobacterales bacterium]
KVALREAFRDSIPAEILDAPKRGFVVPMAEWLRGDLKDLSHDVLLDSIARDHGHFEPDAVRALLDRHTSGAEDRSGAIWSLLVFELWHREVAAAPASKTVSPPRIEAAQDRGAAPR